MTAVIHMYLKTTKYVETLLILLNKNLNNVQSFAFFQGMRLYMRYIKYLQCTQFFCAMIWLHIKAKSNDKSDHIK